jgi:hypothetical protein
VVKLDKLWSLVVVTLTEIPALGFTAIPRKLWETHITCKSPVMELKVSTYSFVRSITQFSYISSTIQNWFRYFEQRQLGQRSGHYLLLAWFVQWSEVTWAAQGIEMPSLSTKKSEKQSFRPSGEAAPSIYIETFGCGPTGPKFLSEQPSPMIKQMPYHFASEFTRR